MLSQRAMDLLEGITKKARCYRAYILMDTMQEGAWGGVDTWREGGSDIGGRNIRGNTTATPVVRRGAEFFMQKHMQLCFNDALN